MTESKEMKRVLVFGGKTGWIGGMMCDLIKEEGASNVGKNCLGIVPMVIAAQGTEKESMYAFMRSHLTLFLPLDCRGY